MFIIILKAYKSEISLSEQSSYNIINCQDNFLKELYFVKFNVFFKIQKSYTTVKIVIYAQEQIVNL